MPSNDQPTAEASAREEFAATLIEALREQEPEVIIDFATEDVLRAADALAAGLVTLGQVGAADRRAQFGEVA
jgi:hypothetical protein